jgi:transglutaminase-like putative cysteine protease
MKRALAIFFVLTALQGHGADTKYPVSDIPEDLRKNVNVVVRKDEVVYTIIDRNKAKEVNHYAVTIFNSKGKHFAERSFFYDKFTKISSLEASVYDSNGKLIKKLKKADIQDQAAFDGSLFSDNRLKTFDLTQGFYPYTIEVIYENEYNYLYSIDGTYLIPGENASVQHASYEIIYPKHLKPRYKCLNINVVPAISTTSEGLESIRWKFENMKPIEHEPFSPDRSWIPQIIAAPSQFEYDGYDGDMTSWESYGKWIAKINSGRDVLPETAKKIVSDLTKNLPTPEEKIKSLYQYMQGKTRYVNVALGIGGLQPAEAKLVDQMGYGDCKGLSNYMVSLLKEAGIRSHYATVMAGDDAPSVMMDFPSHQANHAIVAVPLAADTIWLECTSQTNPFGYMGDFTGDRKAMLITENGGVMVNTPRYTADHNLQSRSADVYVTATGDAKAHINTVYQALQSEQDRLNFILNDTDAQKKWIESNTQIASFTLKSFTLKAQNQRIPSTTIDMDLELPRLATVNGKRLFLTANLMNRNTSHPEMLENRRSPVQLRNVYTDIDTIRYHIPESIYPEFVPAPVSIKSKFGEYEASFRLDAGSLVYTRKLKMNRGTFPAESYKELVEFFKNITKADNTKMVFVSKT